LAAAAIEPQVDSMESPGSYRYRRKLSLESPMRRRLSPQPHATAMGGPLVGSGSALRSSQHHRKMSFPSASASEQNGIPGLELSDAAREYTMDLLTKCRHL
jgi:hypothetical protein